MIAARGLTSKAPAEAVEAGCPTAATDGARRGAAANRFTRDNGSPLRPSCEASHAKAFR